MKAVIGIDLGTSQSAGCYPVGDGVYAEVENEMVRSGVITRENNEKFHPSFVHYSMAGDCIVAGIKAKMLAATSPKTTVYDTKRLIGRRFDDPEVRKYRALLADRKHYEICDENDEAWIRIGDKRISPEDAGAEIIVEILRNAFEQENRLEISRMVISVPAYYDNSQKARTKKAALLALKKLKKSEYAGRIHIDPAGVNLDDDRDISLIPEPSAAFITYMAKGGLQDLQAGRYIMVFDLGAGTLDITIGTIGTDKTLRDPLTRKEKYTLDIVATHGNTALGGRDMDQRVIEYLKAELPGHGVQPDQRLMLQIGEKAERAKIELSSRDRTNIAFLSQGVAVPLAKAKLEELIQSITDQCRQEIRTALKKGRDR